MNGNINIFRFGCKGAVPYPKENYVRNAAFDTWINTSVVGTSNKTETATGWWVDSANGGGVDVTRMKDEYGRPNTYFLRFGNMTAGVGTYQRLWTYLHDFESLQDSDLVLSFEMRASSAGRVFNKIAFTFSTDGGEPDQVYAQVVNARRKHNNVAQKGTDQ